MRIDHKKTGFTLIELLIVLAIVATLLAIVAPVYIGRVDGAKESALIETLHNTRDAIDKFLADTGRYPDSLQDLVDGHYISGLPYDPIRESSDSWRVDPPPAQTDGAPVRGGIYNIHSDAEGNTRNGTPFRGL